MPDAAGHPEVQAAVHDMRQFIGGPGSKKRVAISMPELWLGEPNRYRVKIALIVDDRVAAGYEPQIARMTEVFIEQREATT